jgi:hypothetical protein
MEVELTKSDSDIALQNTLPFKETTLKEDEVEEKWPDNVWILELPPIYSTWNGLLQKTVHTKNGAPIYANFAKDHFGNGFVRGIKLYRDRGYWIVCLIPTGEIVGTKSENTNSSIITLKKLSLEGTYTTRTKKTFQILASDFIAKPRKKTSKSD